MKTLILLMLISIPAICIAQDRDADYLEKLGKIKSQLERINTAEYSIHVIPSTLDSLLLISDIFKEIDSSNLEYSNRIRRTIANISATEKQQRSISTSTLINNVNSYLGKSLIIEGTAKNIGRVSNDKLFILLSDNAKAIFPKSLQTEVLKIKYGSNIVIKGEVSISGGGVNLINSSFVNIINTSAEKSRVLDEFHGFINNIITSIDNKISAIRKSIIESNYKEAKSYIANKDFSNALKHFSIAAGVGAGFVGLRDIIDSANTYIPYMKAIILEGQLKYYEASLLFDSIYTFRLSKPHLENCLIHHYYSQCKLSVETRDKKKLINVFQDLRKKIITGKYRSFYDSVYTQIKLKSEPVLKAWIMGDQKNYLRIRSFNTQNEGFNVLIQELLIDPLPVSYDDFVCFCVINNNDNILAEWNDVQAYNDNDSKELGDYHFIKYHNDISLSSYFTYETKMRIEKWLDMKFLNSIFVRILNRRYPRTGEKKSSAHHVFCQSVYSQMKQDDPLDSNFSEFQLRKVVDDTYGNFK